MVYHIFVRVCILGYNLYIDGKKQNADLITDYTYSMSLLSPGTYTFEVRAVNTVAEGQSATKQLTITPENQYTDGALFTTKDNSDGTCSIIGFSKTANMVNVLEEVTIGEYPQIGYIKDEMLKWGALGTLMSGSGPTVLGFFEREEDLNNCKYQLEGKVKKLIVTKTI